jgi:hypothetical protein
MISEWAAAVDACRSREWEKAQLLARNFLQREVERAQWNRMDEWNLIADELRDEIRGIVSKALSKTCLESEGFDLVRDSASWDLMSICFEVNYSDIVLPRFSVPMLQPWYQLGHFPCGWEGPEITNSSPCPPPGKLLVY